MTIRNVSPHWKLATLALAASLSACATHSQPPASVPILSSGPSLPAPDPRLMEPPPSPSELSASAQSDVSRWADWLQGSQNK